MLRRGCRTDDPRFRNWKRLLLNRLHVSLQEIIVERVIDLGSTFEITQAEPVAIGDLRVGNQTLEVSFEAFDARSRNFIVTLVALCNAAEFIKNRTAQFIHLGAQIDRGQMA